MKHKQLNRLYYYLVYNSIPAYPGIYAVGSQVPLDTPVLAASVRGVITSMSIHTYDI